jgi:hypothetical protein
VKADVRLWHKADVPSPDNECPFSGVKQKSNGRAPMSAYDPKQTSAAKFAVTHNG